ncbi:MAG TPA: BamA/TamA family outer membrane protein [Gemmatimonadales bacterium]|nr:BamA/TamA family outer membrane protein [Gemmatimonadales bacterium]
MPLHRFVPLARASAVLALGAALGPAALPAQQPAPTDSTFASAEAPESTWTNLDVPWRLSYFPFLSGLANDGPLIGARVRYAEAAPYEARVTTSASLTLDAAAGFHGTQFARAEFRAPRLVRGWRFSVLGAAVREARFGFFGLGNDTPNDPDAVNDAQPLFYRVNRTVYRGQLEVSRQIVGPLLLAVQGDVRSVKFSAQDQGPTVFRETFGDVLRQDDASARAALVLDLRDNEYNTTSGALLEAGGQVANGGGNYERLYAVLRGWLPVRRGTVVAARLLGSQLFGEPTLDARFEVPAWERPVGVLGGQFSLRAIESGRFAGKGVLLGNFEVRQEVKSFGPEGALGALVLVGFVDAGRVFEDTDFRLTTDGVKVGGGLGAGVRFLRTMAFTLNLARGPDGTRFTFGYGWMF